RDVCYVVGCVEAMRRACQPLFHRTFLLPETLIRFRSSMLLEIGKDLLVRDLRHFFPLSVNRIESTLRLIGAWRRCAHKISITNNENPRLCSRRAVIVSGERRAKRRWAQHFAVKHARKPQIGRVLVTPGHE